METKRLAVLALAAGLSAACSKPAPPTPKLDDVSAIREAVFRYQLKRFSNYLGEDTNFFCLGITRESDPPPQLLRRFAESRVSIVPVTECTVLSPLMGRGGVVHSTYKGLGLIILAGEVQRVKGGEARVEGGYYADGLAASGNTYTLKIVDGEWKVIGDRENWVS